MFSPHARVDSTLAGAPLLRAQIRVHDAAYDQVPARVPVVEGWSDDDALRLASAGASYLPAVRRLRYVLEEFEQVTGRELVELLFDATAETIALTEFTLRTGSTIDDTRPSVESVLDVLDRVVKID